MRFLDLFSGIGGFSLGLERAGHTTVAFCEIDPYCRKVLKRHWPNVVCYDDVRLLTAAALKADGISVDGVCGGFPCQDISIAGKGEGLQGDRSGLWREYARIIGELRPRFAIVENVPALLGRGLDRVLGDLAEIGYDAEWHCIPAAAVGAPHRRDRVWIVAYPDRAGFLEHGRPLAISQKLAAAQHAGHAVADAPRQQFNGRELWGTRWSELAGRSRWDAEPDVGRVAHGVSARVDRLRTLGNAVVPQIPEIIGRCLT